MNTDKIFRDFLRELFLAKEFLTSQKGQRKDRSAPGYIRRTWRSYCEEIGISCSTADSWVRTFTWADDTQPIRPPVPAGFAAAVWCLNRRKKALAGKKKGGAV